MLRRIAFLFENAGLDEPRADARILVEDIAGVGRTALLNGSEARLGRDALRRLEHAVVRRLAREPVFRILGRREFWGLELEIGPAVLDPRHDTETVVAASLDHLRPRRLEALRVLDLGTGSGAILCALLSELPAATGIGIDISAEACAVARRNVGSCGLGDRASIRQGCWAEGLADGFDLVVSNPPYVESDVIAGLAPEVRIYDPRLALDGGPDGLAAYRSIAAALPSLLAPGGLVVFESGAGQAGAITSILSAAGLVGLGTRRDLGGHERAVLAQKPAERLAA